MGLTDNSYDLLHLKKQHRKKKMLLLTLDMEPPTLDPPRKDRLLVKKTALICDVCTKSKLKFPKTSCFSPYAQGGEKIFL